MLLIRHGHIKPVAGKDFIGDVLVNGGKIAALGEHIEAEGAEVFDAEGLLVTPGFVDAHTHIGVDEEAMRWEGADYNEMSDPVTPDMRGLDGINPMDEAFGNAVAWAVEMRRERHQERRESREQRLVGFVPVFPNE